MTTVEPKRCLGCGYILEGLPENRCPECGRGFDPGDPTTYVGQLPNGRGPLRAALLSWGVFLAGVASAFFMPVKGWEEVATVLLGLLILGPLLGALVVIPACFAARRELWIDPRARRRRTTALILCVLLSVVFVLVLILQSRVVVR